MIRIRLLHWVKFNKIRVFLTGITLCAIVFALLWYTKHRKTISTAEPLKQIRVLVLYSSGNPDAIAPDMSKNIDAITLPTPKSVNTAVIAEMIANSMKKEMLQITLRRISEIKKPEEILFADVILIGSATRFGIMCWQTKKFFDEISLSELQLRHKARLR